MDREERVGIPPMMSLTPSSGSQGQAYVNMLYQGSWLYTKSCIYMYTLQLLCGQRRPSPEVQIYMNTLNDRIGHALQMMVLFCSLKGRTSPRHPKYIIMYFTYFRIPTHSRDVVKPCCN